MLTAAAMLLASCSALAQNAEKMAVVGGQDITGQILKRLGLPNQDYCWQQCLQEPRCTGTRWGVIAGSTAGQCFLLTGDLTSRSPTPLKTQDGKTIVVTASRKTPGAQ
ncbi:MAG: PAN domain-containing protein [Gammaproteobacteria bacterium]